MQTGQLNGRIETDITFDEICEAVPEIRRAYALAKMIGHRDGVPFCANAIWYSNFKPIVRFHVGWTRDNHRRYTEKHPKMFDLEILTMGDLNKKVQALPENHSQALKLDFASQDPDQYLDRCLESGQAYDAAYRAIYNALPDCSHDGMCW